MANTMILVPRPQFNPALGEEGEFELCDLHLHRRFYGVTAHDCLERWREAAEIADRHRQHSPSVTGPMTQAGHS